MREVRSLSPKAAHLLILGGTGEAASLAQAALERFGDKFAVTISLAGRTVRPARLAGQVRIGGFGGAEGLGAYLAAERVDCLIDATHPFAAQISAQAAAACEAAAVPRLVLLRPPWKRHPLDRWVEVADLAGAARALPQLGRRVWLTVGKRDLAAFAGLPQHHFLVRLVDAPATPPPLASCDILLGRGPFNLVEERRILERHAIEVLVAKASGGAATEAKLVAARERDLPVVMVRRPPPPPGERVADIAAALDWLAGQLGPAAPRASEE
jgi:precorrin-6A/cobalt-precorrin-6A reductase